MAKRASGPYNDSTTVTVDLGRQKALYLKAKAGTGQVEGARLAELDGLGSDYKIKYFKGDNNITLDVQDEGHEFNLKPSAKRFRMKIKTIIGPPAPDCLYVDLDPVSAGGTDTIVVSVNGAACVVS